MKKSFVVIIFILVLGIMGIQDETVFARDAKKSVKISEENFPDEDFRYFVKKKCDKNKNGYLSWAERKKVKKLYHSKSEGKIVFRGPTARQWKRHSLKGIEYFPDLKEISITNVNLGKIDVSKNKKLEVICLYGTRSPGVDVSKNLQLKKICCHDGLEQYEGKENSAMKNIDFSRNIELRYISIDIHKSVREIDITALKNLEDLNIGGGGNLSKLDVTQNVNLESFACRNERLKKLDFSNCKKIKWINCRGNRLKELLLPQGVTLKTLHCAKNNLDVIDLTGVKFESKWIYGSRTFTRDKKAKVIYGDMD